MSLEIRTRCLETQAFCYSILCAPSRVISILNMETGGQWSPPLATSEDFLKIDAHAHPHPTI